MKPEYIIFGIVGVVILYFLSRYAGSSAPTIEYVQAEQPDSSSSDAQAQLDAETRLGVLGMVASLAQTETQTRAQLTATQIAADLQRAGIAADERLGLRQIDAQENVYLSDLGNRAEQAKLQLGAVEKASRDFRNQSLERQGTILNAINAAFNAGQRPYDYQTAFGGPRPAPWYAPITQGVGRLIGGLVNPLAGVGL